MTDLLDLHTHTIASGHAYNTIYEMARAARERGLALYGCSDHAPAMPGTCHSFYFSNLKVLPRSICGIPVLTGAELNIVDFSGKVDLSPSLLKKLDYAVASLHTPCIGAGTEADYTNALLGAVRNPLVTIIGHPDDGRFPIDCDALAAAAKEHHTLLEVNNSSLQPDSSRENARENYLRLLERCMHYRTCVIIDSDAHCEADVGNHALAWQLLEEIGFPHELIVNTSLELAAAYIPALARLLRDLPQLFAPEAEALPPIRRWEENGRSSAEKNSGSPAEKSGGSSAKEHSGAPAEEGCHD